MQRVSGVPISAINPLMHLCTHEAKGVEYALIANVLSPEFTEDRVVIGAGRKFVGMFQGKVGWASERFLKGLIGEENWVDEQEEGV